MQHKEKKWWDNPENIDLLQYAKRQMYEKLSSFKGRWNIIETFNIYTT